MAMIKPIGERMEPTIFQGFRALKDAQNPQNTTASPIRIVMKCQ